MLNVVSFLFFFSKFINVIILSIHFIDVFVIYLKFIFIIMIAVTPNEMPFFFVLKLCFIIVVLLIFQSL